MKNLFNVLIILFVLAGAFFAIYLRKEPLPSNELKKTQEVKEEKKIKAPPLLIGILGESRSDGTKETSFNQDVLSGLFEVLNKQNVRTIFFLGNLTFGWAKPPMEASEGSEKNDIIYNKVMSANDWTAKGFTFDPSIFRSQLKKFYSFVNSSFSYPIAFYPMMGDHDAIGINASEIFQDELNIKNISPSPNKEIRYTVSIENAFFAIVPTNYYDAEHQQIIQHTLSPNTLNWLKTVLKEAKPHHRYLFVMGHEPAYSTPSIFYKRSGLDNNPEQRDAFWNILKENEVLAYFSSHEHVYDRSNRDGIWQIVSGGGGSPLNEGQNNHAFFHGLLLTIPQDENSIPSVKVFDTEGNVRDYFELQSEKQPLHQFRISNCFRVINYAISST